MSELKVWQAVQVVMRLSLQEEHAPWQATQLKEEI
jgi:hypothetical protein